MILVDNARVLTLDPGAPRGRAVLVGGGRIARVVGEGAPLPGAEARLDAGGAWLLPGFHDAHVHLAHAGLAAGRVPLAGVRSREEVLERLRAALGAPRDEPALVGEGADESAWGERRFPTREDLDRLSREVPIIVRRVCLHKAVANTAAIALVASAGAAGPADAAGPRAAAGSVDAATGVLLEDAAFSLDARVLAPRPQDRAPAILRGAAIALEKGVTSVDEITTWPSALAYLSLAEEGRLPIRVTLHILHEDLARAAALGLATGMSIGTGGRLTIGGIKLFADGSLGARTAALREAYADDPATRGLLLLDAAKVAGRVAEIERRGFRAVVHAIGDAALDAVLDGFEAARVPRANPRGHRLEHVETVPDAAALERLAGSGLAVTMQPNFVGNWQGDGGLYETRLGRERARRLNRAGSLVRAGIPVAFSSDGMPLDPLYGIACAGRHPDPAERVEAFEAFQRYAEWGSRIAGEAGERGRVAPGWRADLALLSASPEAIAAGREARVLATLVDGVVAYDARGARAGLAADASRGGRVS